MIDGIEDTLGYNALRIADYEQLTGAGENAVDLHLRQFPGTFRGWRSQLPICSASNSWCSIGRSKLLMIIRGPTR